MSWYYYPCNIMKSIPYLIEATGLPGYRMKVRFEDGLEGIIDLSDLPGKGVFHVWNNEQNFGNFYIDTGGKLIWSDEIDMDPDAFYLELIGKTFEEYARH